MFVKAYGEDIIKIKMIYDVSLNDHGKVCNSCIIHIVSLIITFIKFMGIGSTNIYFY